MKIKYTIFSNCYRLLYVSDYVKNEVRRSKRGENEGRIVAGRNGQGDQLD